MPAAIAGHGGTGPGKFFDCGEGLCHAGEEVQASVARCLRTPPEAAKPQDLSFGLVAALRSNGHRSTVVIGNCTVRADNGGTQPSESHPLYTSVDPVSAPRPSKTGCWWSRRVPPPGPIRLLRARLSP